jgi:hypothetical protein
MKFDQLRKTVVKRTSMDKGNAKLREEATPQRISPFKLGTNQPIPGIQMGQIFRPVSNRASRRASGMVATRKRFKIPKHPFRDAVIAHRYVRHMQNKIRKQDRKNACIASASE